MGYAQLFHLFIYFFTFVFRPWLDHFEEHIIPADQQTICKPQEPKENLTKSLALFTFLPKGLINPTL